MKKARLSVTNSLCVVLVPNTEIFRRFSVGAASQHNGGESKVSRAHSLVGVTPQHQSTSPTGRVGDIPAFNPVRATRDVAIRRNASAMSASSAVSVMEQRARASSMLLDLSTSFNAAPPPLESVEFRSEKDCSDFVKFVPSIIVAKAGQVLTDNNESVKRRPVILLFDTNKRFLELSAKFLCRRLKAGNCVLFTSKPTILIRACKKNPGSDDKPQSNEKLNVMWKHDGIVQRSTVTARPGLASNAACLIIKYGSKSPLALSPRRSLEPNAADSLLSSLARQDLQVPTVVCANDAEKEPVQRAIKASC